MNNFRRALKIALAHRVNMAACLLTSLVIALLWGGNLTAVFPVVDVIMNDQSLPGWIDEKIAESDGEVADAQRWLAQLEKFEKEGAETIKRQIGKELELRDAELKAHQAASSQTWTDVQIAENTRLTNFIDRLKALQKLPSDQLRVKIAQQEWEAEHHIEVYRDRAARFRWISGPIHRWMPTTP